MDAYGTITSLSIPPIFIRGPDRLPWRRVVHTYKTNRCHRYNHTEKVFANCALGQDSLILIRGFDRALHSTNGCAKAYAAIMRVTIPAVASTGKP